MLPRRGLTFGLTALLLGLCCGQALPASAEPPPLRVEGNRLLTPNGQPTRLLGVNRSGTEYACADGYGFTDSPRPRRVDSAAMIAAIRSWGANAVRVPLHEHCWLGINGVSRRYGGPRYRRAIATYVGRLNRAGLYAVLDLHKAGPGRYPARKTANGLRPMPDADHAVDFWRSVARSFGADGGVLLDLYNEPYGVDWACWLDGCRIRSDQGRGDVPPYQAVGMQRLVDVVRAAGAENVLLISGRDFAGDLSGWLAHRPTDPLGQIVASFHNYEGPDLGSCHRECWERTIAPLAARVPVVTAEFGDADLDDRRCDHDYIDGFMPWADARGISYLAWAWNPVSPDPNGWKCGSGPALIRSYDGTPTGYGVGLREHLLELAPEARFLINR